MTTPRTTDRPFTTPSPVNGRSGAPGTPPGGTNGHRPDMHWPSIYRVNRTPPVDTNPAPTGRWVKIRDTARLVGPLLLVNALAVYGQVAYAYDHIARTGWPTPYRITLAVGFAAAIEAVALYVGWQAHASLLEKAYAAARHRRVASYLLAALVGGINYAHWADGWKPTEAAVAFGLLSLLSPWLWGMHSRRMQHIQLVREALVDEAGAQFSSQRWRRFPIRTYRAVSWSIEHNVRDPQHAWNGYRQEWLARRAAKAAKRQVEAPPTPTGRHAVDTYPSAPSAPRKTPTTPAAVEAPAAPTTAPAKVPAKPNGKVSTPRPSTPPKTAAKAPTTPAKKWPPVAVRDAATLREKYGTTAEPPGRNEIARQMEWNTQKASDARGAYLAGADLIGAPS